jgi:glucokinase
MEKPFLAGVDIGGTKMAAGIFDKQGKLLGEIATVPTEADKSRAVTLGNLRWVMEEACRLAGAPIGGLRAVGVGSAGPVESATGRLLQVPNLKNLNFFDLASWIRAEFGAALYLENDANCLALGEALRGAGRGHAVVVAVTLGTGFGCGIVIDGVMYSGVTGNAGEVADCPVEGGTFDTVLSGAGVKQFYERRCGGPTALSARELGGLAEGGDERAREAWQDYGCAVGQALGIIGAIIDPSVFVVGGSIAARLPLFQAALMARMKQILAPAAAARIQIAPAKLGPAAGVIGAAEYALYRMRNES